MYHSLCIHSPARKHLGSFQFEVIINTATVDTDAPRFFLRFSFIIFDCVGVYLHLGMCT